MNDAITIPIQLKTYEKEKKLTKRNKKIILDFLAHTWNISKAAALVNCSRQAVEKLVARDPVFKQAFEQIRELHLDNIEETSVKVSCEPSRDGYNDRRLQLEARRKEVYGRQPEVQINQQFNIKIEQSMPELKRILEKIQPNSQVEEADFNEIE